MRMTKMPKRLQFSGFKRPCKRCGNLFNPQGRWCRICEKCQIKRGYKAKK